MDPLQSAYLQRARDALSLAVGDAQPAAGLLAGRFLKATGLVGHANAVSYAENKRWASLGTIKGAISAITTGDIGSGAALADVHRDFLDIARPLSVLGRLPGLMPSPFGLQSIHRTGSAGAVFHSENTPMPAADIRFGYAAPLQGHTVSGLSVVSKEALNCVPELDRFIGTALAGDIAETVDRFFLDPLNDGSFNAPASPLNGAATVASAGSDAAALRYDLETLVAIFPGDLTRAVLITDPITAVQIGLAQQPFGGASLNLAGIGQIFGLPILVSSSSPRDSGGGQIVLVDVSAIRYALDVISLAASENATIIMDTDPAGDPATQYRVSTFQANAIALRASCAVDWRIKPGSVAVISACNYSQAVSP